MPRFRTCTPVILSLLAATAALAQGAPEGPKPEFPPFEQVSKDFEKVVSTADGSSSLYTVYINRKKNQMLAELNPQFAQQKIFIATSIAGGDRQTGWQWKDLYCYWKLNDDQLMLMEPNLLRQAKGGNQDAELRSSVQRTYADRVITSVKVLTYGPNRGPVIDLDDLLVRRSSIFTDRSGNADLATIGKVRAFPENIEIPVTIPMAEGELTTIHYSISNIPKTEYKPREADERIGYFLTVYKDFAKNDPTGQFTRYINRWPLAKRDPSLALSPPTEPIVFYIEHTVPVRYRRWVRDGILEWNKAFEKVGILQAIEVRQQDAQTGAFMDINPEDVRYNFFRWISSERAFAMGPSRVNPETGEILDADIIFDDAMLKNYALQYQTMVAAYGLNGVSPAALEFVKERPLWDPITPYMEKNPVRDEVMNDPTLSDAQKADLLGDPAPEERGRLLSRVVQQNLHCSCGQGIAMQMATANLAMQLMYTDMMADDKTPMIDGVPEEYLGTILKYITCHEVGHTLGLRHNFKASSWLDVGEYVNRKGVPNVGSVMDYVPIYVPPTAESKRGDWMPTTIGPYDYWAIEYGYGMDDGKRAELLKRVAEKELQFATDEDTMGPDPLVARWDLGADPLDWSIARVELVNTLRTKLLDKAVKDGETWSLLRRAYEGLLNEQLGALSTAARYVGGVYVNRDRKGDPNSRDPLVAVEPAKQRKAIDFIVKNAFSDSAFDLRPEVLAKLASDKNRHWGNLGSMDEAFSIHTRVAQIQAFAMLYLMNADTLSRVYDNELRTPADQDAVTIPEVMGVVVKNVFSELDGKADGPFSNRKPMISSLRRNLQSELTNRLVDLAMRPARLPQPVPAIAEYHLQQTLAKLTSALEKMPGDQLDEYTKVHLIDLKSSIEKALNSVKVQQF